MHASRAGITGLTADAPAPSSRERCESGRIGLTANELTWETGSEGSNPSLSARLVARNLDGIAEGWPRTLIVWLGARSIAEYR